MACVGLGNANQKTLRHGNILFMCNPCLVLVKVEWDVLLKKDEERETRQREEDEKEKTNEPEAVAAAAMDQAAEDKETDEDSVVVEVEPKVKVKKNRKMAMKKRCAFRIIGDSMIRRTPEYVKCYQRGSGCTSMSGAGIREIGRVVKDEAKDMEDGLLVVQGGGNGLERTGCEETVREMVEAVKAVEGKNMNVAVIGVLPRPREDRAYEKLRKATNRKLYQELLKMKIEWVKEKKGNVSFLDVGRDLKPVMYARDGVHLNTGGQVVMGRLLREWVKARTTSWVDVDGE